MALYRALDNLRYGRKIFKQGSVCQMRLSGEAERVLIERGAVARVHCPPLSFLGADDDVLAWLEELGVVEGHGLCDLDLENLEAEEREKIIALRRKLVRLVEV